MIESTEARKKKKSCRSLLEKKKNCHLNIFHQNVTGERGLHGGERERGRLSNEKEIENHEIKDDQK